MAEGDVTVEKVPSGYIINREGKHQSSTFFWIKTKEELEEIRDNLTVLLEAER